MIYKLSIKSKLKPDTSQFLHNRFFIRFKYEPNLIKKIPFQSNYETIYKEYRILRLNRDLLKN
ncbi:hypothetical protein [Leptospira interrogans]|uniref:hypothetical protein n=1 Tax=Leptospira interrogans TaxID=173 RepID=UPI000347B8CF|nr:hypothetical protein [Leptospira interrogans]QCO32019.1 hypothetical protein E4414_02060 [Leptospira interrogans]UMQ53457.1 hypothetical protein FH582_16165 [Leptospira interrogans]